MPMGNKNVLQGKKIYAFGDSIVYGHTLPEKCFMKMLAEENDFELTMCAVNGATIVRSDNSILTQVENAPAKAPDLVLFDGYTNDAYDKTMAVLGTMQGPGAEAYDDAAFCGGFEKILSVMRRKWGAVPILFVTIHKSSARKWEIQCTLRELALEICEKWGVKTVDIFKESSLDTRDEEQQRRYIIGGAGSHPNEEGCRTFYMPLVREALVNQL